MAWSWRPRCWPWPGCQQFGRCKRVLLYPSPCATVNTLARKESKLAGSHMVRKRSGRNRAAGSRPLPRGLSADQFRIQADLGAGQDLRDGAVLLGLLGLLLE